MRVSELIRRSVDVRVGLLVVVATWWGCANSMSENGLASPGSASTGGSTSNGGIGGPNSSTGGTPTLPPEVEKESSFQLPVQSGRWVWSANPDSGRVSVIDTRTLTVELARAGFAPTYLAALPAAGDVTGAAIVLNAKSNDATLMWRRASGIETRTVPTHVGANAWAVSPSGRWAIAWTDSGNVKNPDPTDSFQDITVIDTAEPARATRLSVGYRPNRIFYQNDESRAFVVAAPGISVVELAGDAPSVSSDVPLTESPSEVALDVSVLPDGTAALYRVEGSPRVGIVQLPSGERSAVSLSGPVTDLDLVNDGASAIAVVRGQAIAGSGGGSGSGGGLGSGGSGAGAGGGAGGFDGGGESAGGEFGQGGENDGVSGGDSGVGGQGAVGGSGAGPTGAGGMASLGGSSGAPNMPPVPGFGASEVALIALQGRLAEAARLETVKLPDLVGSVAVSSDGRRAVLYTTASDLDRVTVLDTDTASGEYLSWRTLRVRAPVTAVFIAPDTTQALLALRASSTGSVGGAFGIVPLLTPLGVKVQPTDAPVTGVAFAPAPSASAILTAATGKTAYLVHFPALRVDLVPLPSLPLAAGIVAEEGVGYVAQKHPEGRISLVNLDTGEPRTLTGFELAAGVKDEN
jgi:hypothetical protein